MVEIIRAKIENSKEATELLHLLWSSHCKQTLEEEIRECMQSASSAIFIAKDKERFVGVAQCGLRNDYVEGTESSPVGYLEGVYVTEEYRKKQVASQLVQACERWSIAKGCTEFASDCELSNIESFEFHLSIGFTETNRIICFTKKL